MGQVNPAVAVLSAMLQHTLYLFVETMPLLDDKRTVDVEGQGHDSRKHRGQYGEHQRLRDLKKRKIGKKEHFTHGADRQFWAENLLLKLLLPKSPTQLQPITKSQIILK